MINKGLVNAALMKRKLRNYFRNSGGTGKYNRGFAMLTGRGLGFLK
jgi:hypothetical protein